MPLGSVDEVIGGLARPRRKKRELDVGMEEPRPPSVRQGMERRRVAPCGHQGQHARPNALRHPHGTVLKRGRCEGVDAHRN